MNKTILVIGSVTAQQYEPIRLECLTAGHKPKIVRTTLQEFDFSTNSKHNELDDEHSAANSDDETYVRDLAATEKQHLDSFDNIFAAVMPQEVYDEWPSYLGVDFPRWVINNNGRPEFVG